MDGYRAQASSSLSMALRRQVIVYARRKSCGDFVV